MRIFHYFSFLLVSVSPVAVAGEKNALPSTSTSRGDWEFSLSAGPSYRRLGEVRIMGGYRSRGLALPSMVGGNSLILPPIGDTNTIGDRIYNDGYVSLDAGTPGDGSTWNWGYEMPAQIEGDQLIFSATGFQSVFSETRLAPAGGPSRTRDLEGVSPHIQFDARSPHRIGPFQVGLSVGMDFMKADSSLAFSNFSESQTRQDFQLNIADRYELGGVIPPQAPYQGSFGGPGPIISNLPDNRVVASVPTGMESGIYANQVSSTFDVNALSFTLGPTLSLVQGQFSFAVSAGLSLNLYDWKAAQDEALVGSNAGGSVSFATWADRSSGVKFRPGLYLQSEAGYQITEDVGVIGFVRLDATDSFAVRAGPTRYKVDPSGYSLGLMLRYTLPF